MPILVLPIDRQWPFPSWRLPETRPTRSAILERFRVSMQLTFSNGYDRIRVSGDVSSQAACRHTRPCGL
jgi:hypothetical protein